MNLYDFSTVLAISTPIRAAIPVCCTRFPCCAPNREFFRANREYLAPNKEFCSVQFHRIALRLHDQDGVAILRGRRSFAKSRRGGDRWGSVSAAACPREPGRRNEQRYNPCPAEPAPGSGFNLLRIAAYSYIVNADLAYGRVALPRKLAPRRRKAPPGPFSSARRFCTSKVAPNQRPAFARRGPLTKVYRLCRRHAVDVGGRSESDPLQKPLLQCSTSMRMTCPILL